jgi:hypothetical protein
MRSGPAAKHTIASGQSHPPSKRIGSLLSIKRAIAEKMKYTKYDRARIS